MIASASSRISPGKSTIAPSRSASAASIGPFASVIRWSRGFEPAGSSSLPVITSRTRGRRTTRAVASPIELITPTSCGRSTRPAFEQRGAADDVFAAMTDVLSAARRRRSRRWCPRLVRSTATSTDSAGSTESAPAGIGAPVMMRTAMPRAIVPVNGEPGRASPTTIRGMRLYGVAPSVESATHGVAVHRRAIESGDVDVADDGRCQHAARRIAQRHVLGIECAQLRVKPFDRLGDRVPSAEPVHAHVLRGVALAVGHNA